MITASAESAWAPGPPRPQLADGAIHVWRADLTTVDDSFGELLCGAERARAERFASAHDRELWRRARGLLRALLGRYLSRDPSSLRFVTSEHGKPMLTDAAAAEPAFNMSHSRELALYAFSHAGAVGVDVETARRPINEVAIAKRTLGAPEAARLQALDPVARRLEFLRAWARHEATLKCLGVGIGGADRVSDANRPWVTELELSAEIAAAVAAERPARELRCWDWPTGVATPDPLHPVG